MNNFNEKSPCRTFKTDADIINTMEFSIEEAYIEAVIKKWPNREEIPAPHSSELEYIRRNEFNALFKKINPSGETTGETTVTLENFKLWFYLSFLIGSNPDVVFFMPEYGENAEWPDSILGLDTKELNKLKKSLAKSTNVIEENHNIKDSTTLTVDTGTNLVRFERNFGDVKEWEFLETQSLDIQRLIYDYLASKTNKNRYIERLILRYQIGLRPPRQGNIYYQSLNSYVGVNHHIFSSPLDNYYESYGSEYLDTDAPFDSIGSVFRDRAHLKFLRKGGAFEVNCLHLAQFHRMAVEYLIDKVINYQKKGKEGQSRPVLFFVLYEDESDNFYDNSDHHIITYSVADDKKKLSVFKNPAAKIPLNTTLDRIAASLGARIIQERITPDILFPYEKAVVLGKRAQNLADGAPMILKNVPKDMIDLITIAEMELEQGMLPDITIKRTMPNGEVEEVDPNKLFDPTRGAYKYPNE